MEVHIEIPAVEVEQIDGRGYENVETRTPTRVVITRGVHENPNLDVYLAPKSDIMYRVLGHSGTLPYGEKKYETTTAEAEIKHDFYANDLRVAAQKRAGEDSTDEISVLTDWKRRAENNNHEGAIRPLQRAVRRAKEEQ